MFKGKKAVYILVPLNIAIWSFFIYRFYTAYNEAGEPEMGEKISAVKLEELKDSVSYKLSLNYKDPFLKELGKERNYSKGSENKNTADKIKKAPVVIKTPTLAVSKQLPDIKYLGLIKNSTSGAATALISLNGQSKLVKANDVMDGVVFKSFNKDSLIAKWGKEKIVVRK